MKKIEKALVEYWGFEEFLPLQREAMECIHGGVDSVVVLPTGGGESGNLDTDYRGFALRDDLKS